MRIDGVYVALVTPFSASGELDIAAFANHLDRLAGSGISGFVPCGTTGEAPVLEDSERDQIIELTVRVARKNCLKVLAGCGSNSTKTSLIQIQRAQELGVDAALVVTPYYNRPSQEGLYRHYETLASRSHIPIILYNVPGRTGVTIEISTLRRLMTLPNIIGIKESSGNHHYWQELSGAADWQTKSWLAGDDDAYATTLALGGSGIISATANWIPKKFVSITEAFAKGNQTLAFELQRAILPLIRAAFIETNPAPIKLGLSLMSVMSNHLRLPLVPPSETSTEMIQKALSQAELI